MEITLEIKNITLAYNSVPVVKNLSFQLKKGTIGCLLGPSGCGKTTVLRSIAGFEALKKGEIYLNNKLVSKKGFTFPPEKRKIGIVFQDNALFPHLNVNDNIGFGLYQLSGKEKKARVNELLCVTGLFEFKDHFPHELSGGQQQRVALARALAPKPELILLDEPFSNLDGELRERLNIEVKELLKNSGTTAIIVTHDQLEAFSIADEIGVMQTGEIQQWDNAFNLYHHPKNRFVADFIGRGVLIPGFVEDEKHIKMEMGRLCGAVPYGAKNGESVEVLIRPDAVIHVEDPDAFKATVINKAFKGSEVLYTLKMDSGNRLLAYIPSDHNHEVGERIGITLDLNNIIAFKK